MHSRNWNSDRTRRILFSLAAFCLILGAGAAGAASETYQDIPVGFTADGDPFRGNPDAPLTLVEYSDYLCPFCEIYFRQTLPTLLDKYVRTGQVKFVLRDFPIPSLHPTAPKGAIAAGCVAEQGASRFWQMHDALFEAQQQWNRLPDPASFLAEVARKTGADMAAYDRCLASDRMDARLKRSLAAAQALGFSGTPTFQFVRQSTGKPYTLVGAQPVDVFTRWVDTLLAGKEPPQVEAAQKPELPFWAKPEGLAPDPHRPGFTVAGDAYKGNPNAKLVVVEFGDFECPSCQRHALATQPEIDKRFVETGDVLWVVKHFPLAIHRRAPLAAAAAECAADQGKFWAMHDALFAETARWSTGDDPDTALVGLATTLHLDAAKFSVCLASRQALERVLKGIYDGQAIGIKNTPAFILLHGGTGRMLLGTRPADQFAVALREQLDRARSEAKESRSDSSPNR